MKKQILTVVAAMTIGTLASATELDGRWEVVERSCLSGAEVTDNFKMGRDSLELDITDGQFEISQSIDGEQYQSVGTVRVEGSDLIFGDIEDTSAEYKMPYEKLGNTLILFSDGFEEGGSCPIGDVLATRLNLVQ